MCLVNVAEKGAPNLQMQSSGSTDDNVQLLGEEGLRVGGQAAMNLG